MQSECSNSLAERGYAVVPNVFSDKEVTGVLETLVEARAPRSRAGIRHALKYPEIARLAQDRRLIDLASDVLLERAFPYGRRSLTNRRPQIGSWCGTRILLCPFAKDAISLAGGHGRLRTALSMRMLQLARSQRSLPYGCISMIQPGATAR